MGWTWNRDYKDLGQVQEFYPAYLAAHDEICAAGQYPYNDAFRGRVPGIDGPDESRAIYMLQTLRSVREMEATVAACRADGWRDFDASELADSPVRFAAVAEYGWYMGGTGFQQWDHARLARHFSSVMVLPGRNRTNGHLVAGKLIVKDAGR